MTNGDNRRFSVCEKTNLNEHGNGQPLSQINSEPRTHNQADSHQRAVDFAEFREKRRQYNFDLTSALRSQSFGDLMISESYFACRVRSAEQNVRLRRSIKFTLI